MNVEITFDSTATNEDDVIAVIAQIPGVLSAKKIVLSTEAQALQQLESQS